MSGTGPAGDILFRFFSGKTSFEDACVLVKLISHGAELQYDRVILRKQRCYQFAAKVGPLAVMGSCGTHSVKMTDFPQKAIGNSAYPSAGCP